jgi:membrane protease YdiL (CAAX protease family)
MRAFVIFLGLLLAAFAIMALAAYPAWLAVTPLLDDPPFHRVANRVGMLALLAGFVLVARRMRLADRTSLGYGLPLPAFVRQAGLGFALGTVLMLPVVALVFALDLRAPKEAFDAAMLARFAAKGLVTGIAVALIEETFFRGAMFTAIRRESGARTAIVLTSLVYAAVHFIGKNRIPAAEVEWASGLEHIAATLRAFADPASIVDALLALTAVGVVLGAVRAMTGNIAACIGLHAGWVWIITALRETSAPVESAPLAFLVSDYDGFVGWLVLGWTIVIGASVFALRRRGLRAEG